MNEQAFLKGGKMTDLEIRQYFLDGKEGKRFVKDHEDQNPDEVLEILLKQSNIGDLFNKALKRKISELRGAIE